MDTGLKQETRRFRLEKEIRHKEAHQRAALQLVAGMDLDAVLTTSGAQREIIVLRLKWLMKRDRIKSLTHRETYNLARHIALKQIVDRLTNEPPVRTANDCLQSRHNIRFAT